MRGPLPPSPNFLIVGAQRCGTRWLRVNLDKHPEIYTLPMEGNFFNDPVRIEKLGMAGYRRLFDGWEEQPFIGESSPGYMSGEVDMQQLAWRIAIRLPEAKIIAMVRNPVDRAYSAIYEAIKRGQLPADTDVNAVPAEDTHRLGIVSNGNYANSLFWYHNAVGDRLRIIVLDDVAADPAAAYRGALEHIGASPDFAPPGLEKPLFTSARTASAVTGPTLESRLALYEFYKGSISYLEDLIGRDLSSWNPAA